MSIDVPVEQLKAASTEMKAAAQLIDPLDPGTELGGLGGALPGATSGPAASSFGRQLRQDMTTWRDAAVGFADQMNASADRHVANDEDVSEDLGRLRHEIPGAP